MKATRVLYDLGESLPSNLRDETVAAFGSIGIDVVALASELQMQGVI